MEDLVVDIDGGKMSFREVVLQCAGNDALVSEFDRLSGTELRKIGRAGVEAMERNPSEREKEMLYAFVVFVYDAVWTRLPEEAFAS